MKYITKETISFIIGFVFAIISFYTVSLYNTSLSFILIVSMFFMLLGISNLATIDRKKVKYMFIISLLYFFVFWTLLLNI